MHPILRSQFSRLFAAERRRVWQWMLTGCGLFWILVVVAVMSIR